jgi:UDP-N-acetylmuramoylalanine--D-glutamate ligase
MRTQSFSILGIGKRGKSGYESAKALRKLGKEVFLSESRMRANCEAEAREMEGWGVQLEFGGHSERLFEQEILIVCPGIPPTTPAIQAALGRGMPVWSEIELAFRLAKAPLIAITGTNGKTTTTALVADVLRQGTRPAFVGGNIGIPLVRVALEAPADAWIVAEIGAPQLEFISSFRPHIAVLLNFSEDHLDRYPSMAEYRKTKSRMVENQRSDDWVVRNRLDQWSMQTRSAARAFTLFALADEAGVWLEGGHIRARFDGKTSEIVSFPELPLPGQANPENALAAIACGILAGLQPSQIRSGLAAFRGVEHRLEYAGQVHGIPYYNDSSGTNPLSTIRSLAVFSQPVILILGGSEKNANFAELVKSARTREVTLVLFGATKERIAQACRQENFSHFRMVEGDLADVLDSVADIAQPGSVVLFSPACASFDMFQDYEHRGEVFKRLVREREAGAR